MPRFRPALALVLGLAPATFGCRPEPPPPPEGDEVLWSRLDVAARTWPGVLIEFGTPAALPWLGDGWSYGEVGEDGNPMRWAASERASFRFESDREGRRLAFFECAPFRFERSPTQFVGISVNGEELPPLELRPGRERYPVELPVERGENRVELRFRYAGEPSRASADRRKLAVAFYRFELPVEEASSGAGRTGPYAHVTAEDGTEGVWLPAGGSLSVFGEASGASRLLLELGAEEPLPLRAAPGAAVTVTLDKEDGEVYRETFEPEGPRSRWERTLPAASGRHRITLRAEGPAVFLRAELFEPLFEEAPSPKPPGIEAKNVVLVILDGANALRTGLYGYGKDTTPVLDALGRESVVFDVAVSQAVYTIASIGSLLTGQYPERHQNVTFADRLRDDVVTLPALLGRAGMRTAAFSGNAVVSSTFGLDSGYDEFFPVWKDEDYTGHGDSVLRDFTGWLDGVGDERFFAYVHFREPHFPYNPPPPYDARFGPTSPFPEGLADADTVEALNRRAAEGQPPDEKVLARVEALYEGNLAYVDALLGDILKALEARGLLETTAVVVAADHGEAIFEHGFLGHNVQLYEESIRVPLVLHVPGLAPRHVPDVVELIDLTPTLVELAAPKASSESLAGMEGRSLLPLAFGERRDDRRRAFSRTVWDKPRYGVRDERHKLIWDSRTGKTELYDLENDPEEREDLEGRRPFVEGELRQALFLWYREQERLRAGEPPPADSAISQDDRRVIESLGYADQMERKKP